MILESSKKMKSALIGHSGFVGSNLNLQHKFDYLYNSENSHEMTSKHYDMVICAGMPGNMHFANNNPASDLQAIEKLLKSLKTIKTEHFILISTAAVYTQPAINIREDSLQLETNLAYGRNRHYAENIVLEHFKKCLILRLPALFGTDLKKNFIYDMLNPLPAFITQDKFYKLGNSTNLKEKNTLITCYKADNSEYFRLRNNLSCDSLKKAKEVLTKLNYTSLQFTHYESQFQFYDLSCLWKDLSLALENNIEVLNLATEPTTAKEIAKKIFNVNFSNKTALPPYIYDMKTNYANVYGKNGGYIYRKNEIFTQLSKFVTSWSNNNE
ncbi:MAG: NAD(P)-dependent oxidoreductase [Gammaproteobacteria bacterium]|nr:NAD(P)-dependent oxidoreductase [Gammaproteobacteria bacterium]